MCSLPGCILSNLCWKFQHGFQKCMAQSFWLSAQNVFFFRLQCISLSECLRAINKTRHLSELWRVLCLESLAEIHVTPYKGGFFALYIALQWVQNGDSHLKSYWKPWCTCLWTTLVHGPQFQIKEKINNTTKYVSTGSDIWSNFFSDT